MKHFVIRRISRPASGAVEARSCLEAGAAALASGNLAGAVFSLERAVALDPGLWQAREYLGSSLCRLGRAPEALTHYDELLQLRPDPHLQAWVDTLRTWASINSGCPRASA